jgi:thiamine pyrophosphate-dependent acetolactate synthase large subunit-like protein
LSATGADGLVAALEGAGVEVVFGLPGVHNLAAWEALRTSPIRLIGVRHEQAAAYAADGYARTTGRAGVALVTTGPGAANTLGAVGEAWASRSPVVVIATDVPTGLRREGVHRGMLHEVPDQAGLFRPVTKAALRVERAGDVGDAVALALHRASAPPARPVYVEVPTDLLSASEPKPTTGSDPGEGSPQASRGSDAVEGSLRVAAGLLADAQRPLVWAGGGAVDAGGAVAALAERLGAPIFTTYTARGVAGDHPLAVGLPPHLPRTGALWDQADAVVAVGSDLDGMSTQNWLHPPPPRLVAINVDRDDAAKNYEPDVVIEGDATLAAGLASRLDGPREPWVDLDGLRRSALDDLRRDFPAELRFLDAVPAEAVVFADMCIPGYWLAGFRRVPAPRRLAYPMGWGTLGFAFPAALGAAAALLDAPVVSVSGDGGFLFAAGELATLHQERLPLTAVIVDDAGYGMLRYDQDAAGRERTGVDLATPDFEALATSFGLRAQTVEGLDDAFEHALAAHLADAAPSVLVAKAALQPPPTTSPRWYRKRSA